MAKRKKRLSKRDLYRSMDMPMHRVLQEEAQMFSPDVERIASTRMSELDQYFIDVFHKHHGGEDYLDTFPFDHDDYGGF